MVIFFFNIILYQNPSQVKGYFS